MGSDERENLKNLLKFTVDWLYAPVDEDLENTMYFLHEDVEDQFNKYLARDMNNKFKYGIKLKKSINSIYNDI